MFIDAFCSYLSFILTPVPNHVPLKCEQNLQFITLHTISFVKSRFYISHITSLKPRLLFILTYLFIQQVQSQYYLRGTVYDENGKGIYNAKIFLSSKGTAPFYTGSTGAFGIPISVVIDTIILKADGYETIKDVADARKFQTFTMKFVSGSA